MLASEKLPLLEFGMGRAGGDLPHFWCVPLRVQSWPYFQSEFQYVELTIYFSTKRTFILKVNCLFSTNRDQQTQQQRWLNTDRNVRVLSFSFLDLLFVKEFESF